MTYDEALAHLRRILTHSPRMDRDALETVAAGPPKGAREAVSVSASDPRVEGAELGRVEVRRPRRSSQQIIAAGAVGAQHFVKAREDLQRAASRIDEGLATVAEMSRHALQIDREGE